MREFESLVDYAHYDACSVEGCFEGVVVGGELVGTVGACFAAHGVGEHVHSPAHSEVAGVWQPGYGLCGGLAGSEAHEVGAELPQVGGSEPACFFDEGLWVGGGGGEAQCCGGFCLGCGALHEESQAAVHVVLCGDVEARHEEEEQCWQGVFHGGCVVGVCLYVLEVMIWSTFRSVSVMASAPMLTRLAMHWSTSSSMMPSAELTLSPCMASMAESTAVVTPLVSLSVQLGFAPSHIMPVRLAIMFFTA